LFTYLPGLLALTRIVTSLASPARSVPIATAAADLPSTVFIPAGRTSVSVTLAALPEPGLDTTIR